MTSPHQVTKDFERALAEYTGAPHVVAVTSCTMALTLAVAWHLKDRKDRWQPQYIEIPKRTYVGVPYAIREAGGEPTFRHENWIGAYRLKPLPVWDSARWLSSGMYRRMRDQVSPTAWMERDCAGQMVCLSFHATKTLADTQGGAILLDDYEADQWLRRARFDGRTEGVPPSMDDFRLRRAWHCYLSPDVSTRLLWQLSALPKHNEPLPNDAYPDLSEMEVFK